MCKQLVLLIKQEEQIHREIKRDGTEKGGKKGGVQKWEFAQRAIPTQSRGVTRGPINGGC